MRAGEFEKLTRVTFVWPRAVPGEEFSAKVAESRVAYLKATGAYTDAEATAEELRRPSRPRAWRRADLSSSRTHLPESSQ